MTDDAVSRLAILDSIGDALLAEMTSHELIELDRLSVAAAELRTAATGLGKTITVTTRAISVIAQLDALLRGAQVRFDAKKKASPPPPPPRRVDLLGQW